MPERRSKDLPSVFSDVARRKRDAAIARNQPATPGVEAPKDVYAASCAAISEPFLEQGFKFAKSGPHFSKTKAPFQYRVAFMSSHNNIPGRHVSLSMAANVRSSRLKKWRLQQASPTKENDWLAGGMVHLLGTEYSYLEWELADRATRGETIKGAVAFLKQVILPFFELFSDPGSALRHFKAGAVPNVDIANAVEYALCFGSLADAQVILDGFVSSRPDLSDGIATTQKMYETKGLPSSVGNAYVKKVAWLRIAYGLS